MLKLTVYLPILVNILLYTATVILDFSAIPTQVLLPVRDQEGHLPRLL